MFDQTTGQVFKEVTAPRPPDAYQNGRDWSRRTGRPSRKGRSGQGRKGPRALADMAMHLVAENIGDVTEQHLARDDLPKRYLWRIWRLLENRGVCFQAWKIFSKSLLAEDDEKTLALYRYRQHICQPTENLRHYLRPLESTAFDFVSHLVIAGNCSFAENELLLLANMKNLGILEIIQPADELRMVFPNVDDRLIRGWTEMNDPFPLLRILRLWSDESTTTQSLKYVSKFPSLVLYDVNAARSDWPAAAEAAVEEGWQMEEPEHGPNDTLLWYLLLFDSVEESKPRQLQGLARNINEGLMNFCLSSSQPIKLIHAQEAPAFLDHLGDSAKSNLSMYVDVPGYEAQTCKGFPFETWAFWLYSFIGQLIKDSDLKRVGLSSDMSVVSEKLVLPSKPLACLQLGHLGGRPGITPAVSYVRRGLFSTRRYTFFRNSSSSKNQDSVRNATELMKPTVQLGNVETGLNPNRKKRRRLDDILQSFLGS
ncbi:hypothetical protein K4K49_001785 [Colletotrichum sp. SAR 10_70]|nr:hypothetical protein K4K50_000650 [Colletotrichum sp. SAR 10_71]KAI8178741.1 hypothetical protein K4K49_001785 [Colletotrichum sp. SAR 10_70]KAI8184602.1 hypothetical protein KHU50_001900 [Colletotrichum sp. SAR 10_65]KAI8209766.1 hypothetical protein K4K52_013178 [Colletotrichum sp. SAR 10_76]KAI8227708.1 hypothetical protein K4K54_002759 [Colletotrichum sp. SAR 10_86]KAI8248620.1 hypothetical protein K4K53_000711 [Colletotrichum sp. SAR 10_77]KAJ5001272.1 hypothetical protein K4K48_00157